MGTVLKDVLDDNYKNVGLSFGYRSINAFLQIEIEIQSVVHEDRF
jgi:hypothetical protein